MSTTRVARPGPGHPSPHEVMATTPLLTAQHISKHYGALQALDDVSFELGHGEIHGLCGHNGAGKSTFVKILTGLVQPDAGTITIDGAEHSFRSPHAAQAAGVAIVDQELSLAPDLSVDENIFLGSIGTGLVAHPAPRRRRARALLQSVGLAHLDPRTMVGRLSIGERQLVEIARMLGRDAKLLILDEPTATLSDAEIERVFAVTRDVASAGKSVIYISHRLGEVLELCDRVTVMRDGRAVASRESADIAHRDELIRMMLGADLAGPPPLPADAAARQDQIRITSLAVPPVVEGFELSVGAGEIVGLTGQVGSGTSEVLRGLAGLEPEAHGSVEVDGVRLPLGSPVRALRAGVGFASNDRKSEGLFLSQTSRLNLIATRLKALSRAGLFRRRAARRQADELARFVGLDERRVSSPVDALSGGNQQKVFLGRCLDRGDIKLLLLDEPTRGVDVAGRAEIHDLLRTASQAGVAVIFASTEVDEILDLSHVVVTMFGGRVVATRPRAEVTTEKLSADMTMSRERVATAAADEEGALRA